MFYSPHKSKIINKENLENFNEIEEELEKTLDKFKANRKKDK
jgi:hypothetical protein